MHSADVEDHTDVGRTTTNIVLVQQLGTGKALVATATSGGAISGTGGGFGVFGKATSATGIGVQGNTTSTTGNNIGVQGTSASPSGMGVNGVNVSTATTANPVGVQGSTASATGVGVVGVTTAAGGNISQSIS